MITRPSQVPPSQAPMFWLGLLHLQLQRASLSTSINHRTMSSDHHIAKKVLGFINSKKYLSNLEKSVLGKHYSLQTMLASGLMSMPPAIAKIIFCCKANPLTKDMEPEDDVKDMSVSDWDWDFEHFFDQLFLNFDFVMSCFLLTFFCASTIVVQLCCHCNLLPTLYILCHVTFTSCRRWLKS